MNILEQMLKRAQENPQRIVLPEGDEPRTLEAANILLQDKIADLILIGDPQKIHEMAAQKGFEYIKELGLSQNKEEVGVLFECVSLYDIVMTEI